MLYTFYPWHIPKPTQGRKVKESHWAECSLSHVDASSRLEVDIFTPGQIPTSLPRLHTLSTLTRQLKMSVIRLSSVIMECAKCAKCAKYDQICQFRKGKWQKQSWKGASAACVASVPPGMSSICWDNIFISMLCACTCASVKVRSCRSTAKKLSGRRARPCDLASRSDIHEELTPAIPEFRTAQLRSCAAMNRSRQIQTSHDNRLIRLCAQHKSGLEKWTVCSFACPSPHLGDTDSEWHRMAQIYLEISTGFRGSRFSGPLHWSLQFCITFCYCSWESGPILTPTFEFVSYHSFPTTFWRTMSAANPDRGKSTTITTNRTHQSTHNVHNPTFKETGLMAATGYGLMKSVSQDANEGQSC